MNNKEFAGLLALKLGSTKKDAEGLLDTFHEAIEEVLLSHGKLTLGRLGKLEVVEVAERNGVNPQTKESIVIAAKRKLKLNPSKFAKKVFLV